MKIMHTAQHFFSQACSFLLFKNLSVNSLIEKCDRLTALETEVQALFLDV